MAASSSSRSSVRRGARAANAISAAWVRGVSATDGVSGGTLAMVGWGAGRGWWTTIVAAAMSPSRL
jgi:hypothetical protein